MLKQYILLPLYIYPAEDAWDTLYNSISGNPNLLFSIVINPNSGPGGDPGSYPDSNYITGISKLNAYPNTQLLGYVHTLEATRPYDDVIKDIDTYAAWPLYAEADIHMDGIFFDESPATTDESTVAFMTGVTGYAREIIGASGNETTAHVTINPGVPVSDEFYEISDTVISFENYFSQYGSMSSDFPWNSVSKSQRSKSAFLIHHFDGDYSTQNELVKQVLDYGVNGVFVSTENDYDAFSSIWQEFANSMAQVSPSSSKKWWEHHGKLKKFFRRIG